MSKFKQLIDDNIDGLKPFQIGIGDFVEVYKNKNFYAWEQETTLKQKKIDNNKYIQTHIF